MGREEDMASLQELYEYKRRLSAALRSAQVCIFEVDVDRQLYTFFENSEAIFGVTEKQILDDVRPYHTLPPEEYQRKVMDYFIHPEDEAVVEQAFQSVYSGKRAIYEARMRAGSQSYVWCRITVTPVVEKDGMKMIGVVSNIQDLKERIDFFSRENQLDSFTRLYSKRHFEELCASLIQENPEERMAFIIMDLDDFKEANDHFGHRAGDMALLSVAGMLKKVFSRADIIARFGGDEFVVLMRRVGNIKQVSQNVEKCLEYHDSVPRITRSIGIALYPEDGRNYDQLLEAADRALYAAKRTKNTYVWASDTYKE